MILLKGSFLELCGSSSNEFNGKLITKSGKILISSWNVSSIDNDLGIIYFIGYDLTREKYWTILNVCKLMLAFVL
jgi:hypothetical protein